MFKETLFIFSNKIPTVEMTEITLQIGGVPEDILNSIEKYKEIVLFLPNKNGNGIYKYGMLCEIKEYTIVSKDSFSANMICKDRVEIPSITQYQPIFNWKYKLSKRDLKIPKDAKEVYDSLIKNFTDENGGIIDAPTYNKKNLLQAIQIFFATKPENSLEYISFDSLQEITEYIKKSLSKVKKDVDKIVENEINKKVSDEISQEQRVYYLRKKQKIIQDELGEFETEDNDKSLTKKLKSKKGLPHDLKIKLETEIKRLSNMQQMSPEANVIQTYVNKVLSVPFEKKPQKSFKIEKVEKVLNNDHYGLKEPKENILDYLSYYQYALKHKLKSRATILCLVGPPGIGKTSFAQSIAKALDRKFERIALGGVTDESDIRGHRRTYIGAMPGRIIEAMIRSKVTNPVILLDEIDKMGNSFRGDPASALLEVLDPEQNKTFEDRYIDHPYDLSDVLFITTANDVSQIPGPLYDRMETIYLSSYTDLEKIHIAKEHIIPELEKDMKISLTGINDSILKYIISAYTKESGVRNLKRIFEKIYKKTLRSGSKKVKLTKEKVKEYLGVEKYMLDKENKKEKKLGQAVGLAWTAVGGVSLEVQAIALDGSGKLILTGQLGDVMVESAKVSHSYIRSIAKKYKIDTDFYKTKDIHLHFPEGATPKDGPSAGITITTAMFSILSNKKIPQNIAMTGEITISGDVLPVGGIKEKLIGAINVKSTDVILPYENKKDVEVLSDEIKSQINIHFVKNYTEVIKIVFGG